MIVAAFTLNWLDDDGGNVDGAGLQNLGDLRFKPAFAGQGVVGSLRFRQREVERRGRHARPVEFGEVIGLARIGVGQAQRVAAAPMKSLLEMEYLGAARTVSSG